MRILYLGARRGTSQHRIGALERLGHSVTVIDPESVLPRHRLVTAWIWRTGSLGLAEYLRRRIASQAARGEYDLVWVDHGEFVPAGLVRDLKKQVPLVICYNTDNPYAGRDMRLWRLYLEAVPYYDLLVVLRRSNMAEAYAAGAKRVMFSFMSSDEVAHAPRGPVEARWQSEVAFVGTAFEERGPFMAELARLGTPLSIWGNQWQKMADWPVVQPHWRGPGVDVEEEYVKAVSGAKICLGLLSKGNRDLHTQRSLEIPAIGGLLCGERTEEHLALYREGEEAVYWSDAKECHTVCRELLADEARRRRIAAAGRQRALANGWTNERVAERILRVALDPRELAPYHAGLPVKVEGARA